MAWQRPNSVFRVFKPALFNCQLETPIRIQSSPLSPIYQSKALTPLCCQQRLNSTSSAEPAPAAPPIDFNDTPSSPPARIVPASPSYFSGTPKFIDHLLKLERVQAKYALVPTVTPSQAPRTPWLKFADFRNVIGEQIPVSKYRKLQKVLQRLNQIHPEMVPREVKEAVKIFIRPGDPYRQGLAPPVVDEHGRARAIGRRKTSSAQVYLVEGDGQVLVNGENILKRFHRIHDRESALWALRTTNRLDKYNVFALVRGGGLTGQAEALTVATARALAIHEPALKSMLRQGMYRLACLSPSGFPKWFSVILILV